MSSEKYLGEDNASYAYDPAQREARDQWRRAVVIAEGVRPALAVVFTAFSAVVLMSSIGTLAGAIGKPMGSGALDGRVPEPGFWATLRQSGALRIMALLLGFVLLSTVAAAVRAALGNAPGALYLGEGGGAAAIVREARAAAIAARQALGRLQSEDLRQRLQRQVDVLDATTRTMASVMASDDSRELQLALSRRCWAVEETAAELAQLVDAEFALESLVPAIPPTPPPDPATLLEANDALLQSAQDEVRCFVRGIEELTGRYGDPVSTPPYHGGEAPGERRVRWNR